jgi:hypothetical protein
VGGVCDSFTVDGNVVKLEVKDLSAERIALGLKMAIEEAIEKVLADKKFGVTFMEN